MDETATQELTDEDIRTVMPGTSTAEGRDRSRHRWTATVRTATRRTRRTATPPTRTARTARTPTAPTPATRTGPTARREPATRSNASDPGRRPLERCTGDARSFLANDWGKRAAVRRGGPSPSPLAPTAWRRRRRRPAGSRTCSPSTTSTGSSRRPRSASPFFRLVKAGERQIPESAYTRSGRAGSREVTGIANPARVAALFEDGATIVLQGLHRWSDPVARFCRDLELELGHPCQVNAYITPPGAQGLDLHEDAHDVFVLQAFGRKRWEVHAAPARGGAGSSRRRGDVGRHDLHARGDAARRPSAGRLVRATSRSAST